MRFVMPTNHIVTPDAFVYPGGGLSTKNNQYKVDFPDLDSKAIRNIVLGMLKDRGGIVTDADGKLYVDFDSMDPDILKNIVLSMIQDGGGISVDSDGKLYVDFESMPTDKFENLLKSIRVPIWLTKNTTFYVNGTTGSDALDDGRGLSSSKPFKTIQACINYVVDNYNLSKYTAQILITAGTYKITSTIELGKFTASTGSITLVGEYDENGPTTIIEGTDISLIRFRYSGLFGLRNVKLIMHVTPDVGRFYSAIITTQGATLDFGMFHLEVNISGEFNDTARWLRLLHVDQSGTLNIRNVTDVLSRITINNTATGTYAGTVVDGLFICSNNSNITMLGANSAELAYVHCSGNIGSQYFIRSSSKAMFGMNTAYDFPMRFADDGFIGMRYACTNGGMINTTTKDPNYFPGTLDGIVDEATYSWYK